jgi:hypothetical protein
VGEAIPDEEVITSGEEFPQEVFDEQSFPVMGQGSAEEEADTGYPDAHAHVETVFVLPKYNNLQFPIGEAVEIICGFRNNAAQPLNVTRITGSLNFAQDFKYYIQNVRCVVA